MISPVIHIDEILRELAEKQRAGRELLPVGEVVDLLLDLRAGYRHPESDGSPRRR
jgi:hypothetical protein